ncbi:hypothetical protein [Mycolicibacterium sediminis]|uniref:Uncharacterized protein n=1 Tax=Mycolicibacterium sediminis TaxID=1286180 RepID=A0A7I7QWK7_9MYCO|nr:hypothetical protein [Mycolicibacterium sediminis]BBY30286.1 hypothetical protein MSEDJ_43820 [Mycolicibacterium sediminis]
MDDFERRPATELEIATIKLLLPPDGFPDVDVYRDQADHLCVTDRCSCGCPTIGVAVDRSRCRRATFAGTPLLPVEAEGTGEDHVQLLLFARDGWLESLELVTFSPPARPTFPPASELRVVNRYPAAQ